jgi:hypothetical protein
MVALCIFGITLVVALLLEQRAMAALRAGPTNPA